MANKRKSKKRDNQSQGSESALLDMSNRDVKKMIKAAKSQGFVTYEQLNKVTSAESLTSEQIEDVMSMLSEMGINIIEDEDVEEEEGKVTDLVTVNQTKDVAVSTGDTEKLDRTDDPVRMYLREMGSVELLSREGEIAIAKRIEAGRNTMISGLCESPLTFQAITIWRDELLNEDILLRDVIDLEATFGNQLGEDDEPVISPHGGGGTAFSPIFKYMQEKDIDPVACVVLTDLCCDDFGDEPAYPVLWAVSYTHLTLPTKRIV